jgi:AcrR family transcriptional regulator
MTRLRSQQRLATQKAILATARKLFHHTSFNAVGVRDIAAEAGVATGTVISAFGSKVDLLHEIVVEDLQQQFELMKTAVANGETTHQRLINLCLVCIDFQASRIEIVRASMADAWTRSDVAENRIRTAIRPVHKLIVQELERGVTRGEVRADLDLKLGATLILETLINTYRLPLYDEKPFSELGTILRQRLEVILWGLGAQPANSFIERDGGKTAQTEAA